MSVLQQISDTHFGTEQPQAERHRRSPAHAVSRSGSASVSKLRIFRTWTHVGIAFSELALAPKSSCRNFSRA